MSYRVGIKEKSAANRNSFFIQRWIILLKLKT
ncbi:hypothetical protein Avbf_10199 [Armadillidium vulgare]|nr:hypothetical protein Avbf_10199 [Armadillidium vulgare]